MVFQRRDGGPGWCRHRRRWRCRLWIRQGWRGEAGRGCRSKRVDGSDAAVVLLFAGDWVAEGNLDGGAFVVGECLGAVGWIHSGDRSSPREMLERDGLRPAIN